MVYLGLHEHWFNHQFINSSGIFRICGLEKDLSLSPGGIGFIFFPFFSFWDNFEQHGAWIYSVLSSTENIPWSLPK